MCRAWSKYTVDVYAIKLMYTCFMKRLQIYIEEELDERLAVEASREGTSKAALIRRFVAEKLRPAKADPLDEVVGWLDVEAEPVDDVVYGR